MNQALNYLKTFASRVFSIPNFNFILMTFLLVIEIELYTTWRNEVDLDARVYVFLGVQLLIGILPLILMHKVQIMKPLRINFFQAIPLSMAAILGIIYAFNLIKPLIDRVPIKVNESDIIPLIQHFCKEMWAGRFPYAPFDDFGYTVWPTYLPAQWLPFMPSEYFKIEPRLLPFAVFGLIYAFFTMKIIKAGVSVFAGIALLGLPILLIALVLEYDPNTWSITIEQLIMSYYLLLGLSLTTDSRAFQIVAIVLCLMSRFALIFWLPLYVFMLWTKDGVRPTVKFCLGIAAGCAVLYGPFLLKDPMIFANAQGYYNVATERAWQSGDDKPASLYNGLGFAVHYFEKGTDKLRYIAQLKKLFFIATPSVSLIFGLIWWRLKDKLDSKLFSLCALKVSLAVFFSLIHMTYSYLYVTPIMMSLAVLYRFSTLTKAKLEAVGN
jgi:hypothetical protein